MTNNDLQSGVIEKLKSLKAQLEEQDLKAGSLEEYLLHHVNKYLKSLAVASSFQDANSAAAVFSRFCTESMDWDTPLYKQCSVIAEDGFRLAKQFREKPRHSTEP